MKGARLLIVLLVLLAFIAPVSVVAQSEDPPVVRAVLFHSPNCGHCAFVINEVLAPMIGQYGDQLQILSIDVTQQAGQQLYLLSLEEFNISDQRRGVPMLFVGDTIMVGSGEIPERFPAIVEEGLAADGIAWPDIPQLELLFPDILNDQESETGDEGVSVDDAAPTDVGVPTSVGVGEASAESVATAVERQSPEATPQGSGEQLLAEDSNVVVTAEDTFPEGAAIGDGAAIEDGAESSISADFVLAAVILVGMLLALMFSIGRLLANQGITSQSQGSSAPLGKSWPIPLLAVLGLGVSAYLAYVEITHVEAVCGPIGECNLVQSSSYATILGIPVAVLGMLSYLAIIALWLAQKYVSPRMGNLPAIGLIVLTLIGTLFSVYLTLIELFVIEAVCAWCLTSAVITTALMLLVVIPLTKGPSPVKPDQPATADFGY